MRSNFFEYLKMPVSFFIDEGKLKKEYYKRSREVHPDHNRGPEAETSASEKASYNNEAYKTLKNFTNRVKYILELEEVFPEEGSAQLPQSFLLEMMDVNEQLMELEFDFNREIYDKINTEIAEYETLLRKEVEPYMKKYTHGTSSTEILAPIIDFYFKQKYLWRLKENLDKFASH